MGLFGRSGRHVRKGTGATIIAEGCTFRGELQGLTGPLYVEGRVEGVVLSEAEVIVGPRGHIEGAVKARHLVVNGQVDGQVVCEQLDIMAAGTVRGELHTGRMTIEEGGRFLGESHDLGEGRDITVVELKLAAPAQPAALDRSATAVIEAEADRAEAGG